MLSAFRALLRRKNTTAIAQAPVAGYAFEARPPVSLPPGYSGVRSAFVSRMRNELEANEPRKGPWGRWWPNRQALKSEMSHHVAKLFRALNEGDVDRVSEYSADIANIAMKADEVFGKFSEADQENYAD